MATFKSKIESYIGTYSDTQALSQWLTQISKTIINMLPLDKALKYSVGVTDDGTGVTITGYRVLRAHKDGYEAVSVNPGMASRVKDSNSIFYATPKTPISYVENGKLFILPGGGTAIGMAYPTVSYSDESISNFPQELEQAVVLYCAIQGRIKQLSDVSLSLGNLSMNFQSVPSVPSAPDFSYVDATVATIAQTTIGSFGNPPTYSATLPSKPSLVLSLPQAPTPPNAPSFTYTEAVAAQVSQSFITSLNSQYNDLYTFINTKEDFELAKAKIDEITARIQEFAAASEIELKKLSDNAKQSTDVSVQNKANDLQKQIQQYRSGLDNYATQLEKYKSDTQALLEQQKLNLTMYQSDSQTQLLDALNKFNKENAEYQANIQKMIEQARLDEQRLIEAASQTTNVDLQNKAQKLTSDIQLYSKKLELYQNQLGLFSAQVNEEVNRYNADISKTVQQHETMKAQLEELKNEYNNIIQVIGK